METNNWEMPKMWHYITFRSNTRKQHLDKHERICREMKWLEKGESYNDPTVKNYVIMDGARLIGYYSLKEHKDKQVSFCCFYINPESRNKGLGTIVLLKVLHTLYSMNKYNTIFCRCDIENKHAQHIYEKYGFYYCVDEQLREDRGFAAIDQGDFIFVFAQKLWGETDYKLKGELQDVFNTIRLSKQKRQD